MKNEISKDYLKAKETIEKGINLLHDNCQIYDIFLDNMFYIINNTKIKTLRVHKNRKLKDIYGEILIPNKSKKMIKKLKENTKSRFTDKKGKWDELVPKPNYIFD